MKFEFYKIYEDHELDAIYYEHGEIIGIFHHEPCRKWETYELNLTHCADEEFLALLGVISLLKNEEERFSLTKFLKYEYRGIDYYTINIDLLIEKGIGECYEN